MFALHLEPRRHPKATEDRRTAGDAAASWAVSYEL